MSGASQFQMLNLDGEAARACQSGARLGVRLAGSPVLIDPLCLSAFACN